MSLDGNGPIPIGQQPLLPGPDVKSARAQESLINQGLTNAAGALGADAMLGGAAKGEIVREASGIAEELKAARAVIREQNQGEARRPGYGFGPVGSSFNPGRAPAANADQFANYTAAPGSIPGTGTPSVAGGNPAATPGPRFGPDGRVLPGSWRAPQPVNLLTLNPASSESFPVGGATPPPQPDPQPGSGNMPKPAGFTVTDLRGRAPAATAQWSQSPTSGLVLPAGTPAPTAAPDPAPDPAPTPDPTPAPPTRGLAETRHAWRAGQQFVRDPVGNPKSLGGNLGHIAGLVGGRIDHALSNKVGQMGSAQYSRKTDPTTGQQSWVDLQGNHVADVGANGEPVNAADPMQAAQVASTLALTSRVGRVLGSLTSAGGGSLLGGIAGTAAKIAGPVAIGATLVTQGVQFAQEQREANRGYQKISGGTNAEGFQERIGEKVFDVKNMLTMGGGAASRLYQGISSTGLQGEERTQALNFATQEFRRSGMDTEDTMKLISRAVRNGNLNLKELSSGLEQVGQAAKNAGTNVDDARKQFSANYEAVSTNTTQGGAGASITTALTAATTALGPQMADVNLTALASTQNQYEQASLLGMPVDEYMAKIAKGDAGSTADFAKAAQMQLDNRADSLLSPQGRLDLQEKARSLANPDGSIDPQVRRQLGYDALAANNATPDMVVALAEGLGIPGVTAATAGEFIFNLSTGGINLNKQVEEQQNSAALADPSKVGGKAILGGGKTAQDTSKFGDVSGLTGDRRALAEQNNSILSDLGYDKTKELGNGRKTVDFSGKNEDAYQTYLQRTHDSGQRNAAVEKLLGSDQEDYSAARFVVETEGGPKEVGFEDLIRNYADQVSQGTVKIKEGPNAGKTVGEVTDMTSDVVAASASEAAKSGTSDVTAAQGAVEIYATDKLREYLGFTTSGSAVDKNRETGAPNTGSPSTRELPNGQPR